MVKIRCNHCHGTGMVEQHPYWKLDGKGFGTPDSHDDCDIITCKKCNLNKKSNFKLKYGCHYWEQFPPE